MVATPFFLCLNPWIYDFAAHDYFARPLGLAYLAGWLRAAGARVAVVDCLGPAGSDRRPTGRWPKTILPKPPLFADVPRRWGRYGRSPEEVAAALSRLAEPPAAVLVTSHLTYWYPGVQAVIALVRQRWPEVPVILGGIYATLCQEHARRHSGADYVLCGPAAATLFPLLAELLDWRPDLTFDPQDFATWPSPAWDLVPTGRLLPLLTSQGCPFACDYCASRRLAPRYQRRAPAAVVAEITYWHQRLGVTDLAFYDDALLFQADSHFLPLVEGILGLGLPLRCHTPNGLHIRYITPTVARYLRQANFVTLRLGLETTTTGAARHDRKVTAEELIAAVAYLQEAGYRPEEIGVYLLIGLPDQEDAAVVAAIREVRRLGATPVLAAYSPIPHTVLWEAAVRTARYDLQAEPLAQNNSVFPCWPSFSWERYTWLKNLAAGRTA